MAFPAIQVLTWLAYFVACAPHANADQPAVIAVRASMPGASATELDSAVSQVLEQSLLKLPGLERIESTALPGRATTVVWIKAADPDAAMQAVQERLNVSIGMLPTSMPAPPQLIRGDPDAPPRFILALCSDTLPLTAVTDVARIRVAQTLSMLVGVSKVEVLGGRETEISVVPDADQMTACLTSVADLERAIAVALRGIKDDARDPGLELSSAVIRFNGGQAVSLKDLARVETGSITIGFARLDGAPAVLLAVSTTERGPSVAELQKSLARIRAELPPAVRLIPVADLSTAHALAIQLRHPSGTSADQTEREAEEADHIIEQMQLHATARVFYTTGEPDSCHALVFGDFTDESIDDLRTRLAQRPESTTSVRRLDPAATVRIALCGLDREKLAKWAQAVVRRLATERTVVGPDIFPAGTGERMKIEVDRARLAALGVDPAELDAAVKFAAGELTIRMAGGSVVAIRPSRQGPLAPEQLAGIQMHGAGKMVPLSAVAKMSLSMEPNALFRVNGFPAIVVEGAVPAGASRNAATTAALPGAMAERETLGLSKDENRAIELNEAPSK